MHIFDSSFTALLLFLNLLLSLISRFVLSSSRISSKCARLTVF